MNVSLSARRAWIEILAFSYQNERQQVALRKESVDRNYKIHIITEIPKLSLSARRAWIEISDNPLEYICYFVALRKESVDRNSLGLWIEI